MIISQKKYVEIRYFFQTFWKDGISKKKISLEYDIFCNIWKDIFCLGRKWKVIFVKTYMEIWYFLYIFINVTNMILPFRQENKDKIIPKKVHLKVTFPASLKKMIFILENMVYLLKYHIDWCGR